MAFRVPTTGFEPDNRPWRPVVDDFLKFPFLDALPKDRLHKALTSAAEVGGGGGGVAANDREDLSRPYRVPIVYGLDADAGSTYVENLNISSVSNEEIALMTKDDR